MSKSDNQAMSRSERREQKQRQKKPKNTSNLWKKILLGILGVILAVGIGGLGLFVYYAASAPELTQDDLTGTYSSDLVDMNGEVFYSTGGEEREYASADEYPQVMIDAIIAIEDQRFESHIGIDPIGIARAAVGYITNAGEIVGGGSTITQQLIKLSVFSTSKADQTLERKAQEAWLALQLERQLSKEQIMTYYLNRIHMGSNVYGVATAAQEYYGKHVSELELHEAAMFAAMPKGPNYYNPYVDEEAATNRRNLVLQEMVGTGAITQAEADAAKAIPVTEGLQERTTDENYLVFDSYLDLVIREIQAKTEFDIYTAGLTIHTNYDPNAQELLYDVTNTDDYLAFPNDEIQTAATLVDSTTGKITAVVGARKYEDQLVSNHSRSELNVGSTIKPLTTYGPAIEFEEFSTYHQVIDEPRSFGNWSPRNWDRQFKGQMSIRDALVDSRNIPTAQIFVDELNHSDVGNFLNGLGIDPTEVSSAGELVNSNAIDGAMTPIQLAGAYAAFANEGYYTEPYTVSKIITQAGEEIDLVPETNKAMEDYTAYMVTDILKGVIDYYGQQLRIPGYIHAAKTGTTNYTDEQMANLNIPSGGVPDNWVVGYSPYYTMSVWVGYPYARSKENNYLHSSDGSIRIARDIYRVAMGNLIEGFEQRDWQQPDSVVELSIEDGTNPALLAPAGSSNAVSELFVRGSSEIPSETAQPEFELTAPTGLAARYVAATDDVAISWDAFSLPEGVAGDVEYVININGQEEVISDNQYTIDEPPREVLNITVAVRVGDETGPTSSVQIIVPEPQEEEPEPEEPEEPEEPVEPTEPEEPQEPETPEEPGGTPPADGNEDNAGNEDDEANGGAPPTNDENNNDEA